MNQIPQRLHTPSHEDPITPGHGRIAFVQSCWHRDIVDQCRAGFVAETVRLGRPKALIDFFEVPGAFEIPLQAKSLARTGRYAAIVAAGFVVDGGIYRHDFVATAVVNGLMRATLDTGVPVLSVALTPHHFQETAHHVAIFKAHFVEKGREAARAALMIGKTRARVAA